MTSREPSLLEKTLQEIIVLLINSDVLDDHNATLTPGEFKELVHQQLPHFMKNVRDLDEKMRNLDVNNDKKLEFGEFWQLLGEIVKENNREELGKK